MKNHNLPDFPGWLKINSWRQQSMDEGGNRLMLRIDRSWMLASFHFILQAMMLAGSVALFGEPIQRAEIFVLVLMAFLNLLVCGIDTAFEKTLDIARPEYDLRVNAVKTLTDYLGALTRRVTFGLALVFMMLPDPNWTTFALVSAYFWAFPLLSHVANWTNRRI